MNILNTVVELANNSDLTFSQNHCFGSRFRSSVFPQGVSAYVGQPDYSTETLSRVAVWGTFQIRRG